jgi:hypothetical protein
LQYYLFQYGSTREMYNEFYCKCWCQWLFFFWTKAIQWVRMW